MPAATRTNRVVSIRSPHRSKGRLLAGGLTGAQNGGFNPLPSPKQGETARQRLSDWKDYCFNPLPSPKQGETFTRTLALEPSTVSIRSPHRSKGRRGGHGVCDGLAAVSIRSPHRSKGRPQGLAPQSRCAHAFQSAPLTEARGDRRPSRMMWTASTRFNPLPSPKQGETACARQRSGSLTVSIRSPHRSKGRHLPPV